MAEEIVNGEDNREHSVAETTDSTGISSINMSAITTDISLLCPIRYVYDYLPYKTMWLKPQQISVPITCSNAATANGITLCPKTANIPFYTGLGLLCQSKYWRVAEEAAKELLELFAQDQSCQNTLLANGQSIASLAKSELASWVMDGYSRFSIYMFPYADERRTRLLAQCIVLIFIFDGKHMLSEDAEIPEVIGYANSPVDLWERVSSNMVVSVRCTLIF